MRQGRLEPARAARYAVVMRTEIEAPQQHRTPVVRKAAAGVILVIAAVLAVKLVIGIVTTIFFTIVALVVVVAVLWALKTLI